MYESFKNPLIRSKTDEFFAESIDNIFIDFENWINIE